MPEDQSKGCSKFQPKRAFKSFLLFLVLFISCYQFSYGQWADGLETIKSSRQLIVVTAADPSQKQAFLSFFQKDNTGTWRRLESGIPVMLGAHGMGYSFDLSGLFTRSLPIKKEGDLKAPAGVFPIHEAFSFDTSFVKMNLTLLKTSTLCVDDTSSSYYNQIIDSSLVKKDWSSSEHMRKIPQYRYGLVIDQNSLREKGKGSCIFVHIWSGKNRPTAGCTSMEAGDLLRILGRLNESEHPLIVQMTKVDYEQCRKRFKFPDLKL